MEKSRFFLVTMEAGIGKPVTGLPEQLMLMQQMHC